MTGRIRAWPAVVMTDGCPCVSPSPCLSSSQGHVGVAPAELSPLVYCFLVALAPHHPLSHPNPSESILALAKYTLVLATRRPPPSPSTLTEPPLSQALTYFAPSSSFSFFLILFPLLFLLLLRCNPHLASLCHPHLNSLQYFSLHMQQFEHP